MTSTANRTGPASPGGGVGVEVEDGTRPGPFAAGRLESVGTLVRTRALTSDRCVIPAVTREEHVAATLERAAAALREGEAELYGYRVRNTPAPHETGAVSFDDAWLEFRVERR